MFNRESIPVCVTRSFLGQYRIYDERHNYLGTASQAVQEGWYFMDSRGELSKVKASVRNGRGGFVSVLIFVVILLILSMAG